MATNYEDSRLTEVKNDEAAAIAKNDAMYNNMVNGVDTYYEGLKNNAQNWADKQTEIQQEKTDFAIEQIEQQKEQTKKDYIKEQSGAYVDWQKQQNNYGVNAEQMADNGMTNTGYSESSKVSMYNTYQNRITSAREVYNRAVLNYDNSIKDAQLQNNSILAEIAYNALQTQLELSLEGFQYKNTLIQQKADRELQINNMYQQKWVSVLNQINQEKSFALQEAQMAQEQTRWEEEMAWAKEKDEKDRAFQNDQFEWQKSQDEIDNKLEQDKFDWTKSQTNNSLSPDNPSYSIPDNYFVKKTSEVSTPYYQGPKNPDAYESKYGAFSNGYQPKGISGHGKLSKTGKTEWVETSVQYGVNKGQIVQVKQNIWKAEDDGTLWIWNGIKNRYDPVND